MSDITREYINRAIDRYFKDGGKMQPCIDACFISTRNIIHVKNSYEELARYKLKNERLYKI